MIRNRIELYHFKIVKLKSHNIVRINNIIEKKMTVKGTILKKKTVSRNASHWISTTSKFIAFRICSTNSSRMGQPPLWTNAASTVVRFHISIREIHCSNESTLFRISELLMRHIGTTRYRNLEKICIFNEFNEFFPHGYGRMRLCLMSKREFL